jgi:hypothetical protein
MLSKFKMIKYDDLTFKYSIAILMNQLSIKINVKNIYIFKNNYKCK